MNIAIQELNEKSELVAWENTKKIIDDLLPKCFDYGLDAKEPIKSNSLWRIPLFVNVTPNGNMVSLYEIIINYLKSAGLSPNEFEAYAKLQKKTYEVGVMDGQTFYLRNESIKEDIAFIFGKIFTNAISNFQIENGIESYSLLDFMKQSKGANSKEDFYTHRDLNYFIDIITFESKTFGIYPIPNIIWFGWCDYYVNLVAPVCPCGELIYKDYNGVNNQFLKFFVKQNRMSLFPFDHHVKINELELKKFVIPTLNLKKYLEIHFSEIRTMEEIKKISEYKVSPIFN